MHVNQILNHFFMYREFVGFKCVLVNIKTGTGETKGSTDVLSDFMKNKSSESKICEMTVRALNKC